MKESKSVKINPNQPYEVGEFYIVRTVTMIVTGYLIAVGDRELVLNGASWVADTERYHQFVTSLAAREVEAYPPDARVLVGRGAVIDAVAVKGGKPLPTK